MGTRSILFGYYNFFEDAEKAMRELFDHTSDKVIPDGIKVGKSAPRANSPKVRRKRVLPAAHHVASRDWRSA